MAYTSVIPVRRLDRAVKYVMNKEKTTAVSLQDALDYAANRDKTEKSCFESSYACTLETAFADMRQTKERWHKPGGVQGYHLVQSFAGGEVTPELAHQIAKELADRVLGGRYEYVIGTHLNTNHIHSHIVADQDGGDQLVIIFGQLERQRCPLVSVVRQHLEAGLIQRRECRFCGAEIGGHDDAGHHCENASKIIHFKLLYVLFIRSFHAKKTHLYPIPQQRAQICHIRTDHIRAVTVIVATVIFHGFLSPFCCVLIS